MKYADYQSARDASWETLVRMKVKELPVKVSDICNSYGYVLLDYQVGMEPIAALGLSAQVKISDGFSTIKDYQYYIFYNPGMSAGRIGFTVAHELGHILLGHLRKEGQITPRNKEPAKGDPPTETMANVYASRLLAPAFVLHSLKAESPEEISRLCDISLQSATFRAQRMELLNDRDKFDISPLERAFHKQFMLYILKEKLFSK